MTHEELVTELEDLFDVAICNSLDMDWKTLDGARACAAALLAEPKLVATLAAHLEVSA
jgi:hypothetical protein